MKNTVSVICVVAVVACRSAAIDGNAGRYMSMANGPTADSSPSTMALRLKEDVMRVFSCLRQGRGRRPVQSPFCPDVVGFIFGRDVAGRMLPRGYGTIIYSGASAAAEEQHLLH